MDNKQYRPSLNRAAIVRLRWFSRLVTDGNIAPFYTQNQAKTRAFPECSRRYFRPSASSLRSAQLFGAFQLLYGFPFSRMSQVSPIDHSRLRYSHVDLSNLSEVSSHCFRSERVPGSKSQVCQMPRGLCCRRNTEIRDHRSRLSNRQKDSESFGFSRAGHSLPHPSDQRSATKISGDDPWSASGTGRYGTGFHRI